MKYFLLLSLLFFPLSSMVSDEPLPQFLGSIPTIITTKDKKSKAKEMISFQFYGKNLGDLLKEIAAIKKINIVFPSGTEKIDTVINFSTPEYIALEEVEELLLYFLFMAGYVLTIQDGVFLVTKRTDDLLRRYLLPLYIDIEPHQLPDNPGYIRAIYFLKNLRVPGSSGGSQSIAPILLSMIPRDAVMVDPRSNCIIITAPSNVVASVMTIILAIDNFGITDEVAMVQLKHTSAPIVAKLLEDLISIAKEGNPQIPNSVSYMGGSFFSPQTKIVQNPKNNELILMGKKEAIEKMIEFIKKEIDVPIEGGTSLVHVYQLQYIEARRVAPLLQSIVSGRVQAGQSVKEAGVDACYRSFDGVRILAEELTQLNPGQDESKAAMVVGSNRLIIVANADDYKVIEKIIQEIDRKQPQVIVEVMILDVEVDDHGNFSSQFRLPGLGLLPGLKMQSVMMDNSRVVIGDPRILDGSAVVSADGLSPSSTIHGDLLAAIKGADIATDGSSGMKSLIDNSARGGVIISIADPYKSKSIAGILQLEQSFAKRSVIANPYSIVRSNSKTIIKNIQIKRGEGNVNPSSTTPSATVVDITNYSAALGIEITPHVMYRPESGSAKVSLQITMNIEDFKNDSNKSFDKLIRGISTNAHIDSGDILVIGGLFKESLTTSIAKVPVLGDIPILGLLFQQHVQTKNKTNLVVFVKATVVDDSSFQEYIDYHERSLEKASYREFSQEKDPVVRLFFK